MKRIWIGDHPSSHVLDETFRNPISGLVLANWRAQFGAGKRDFGCSSEWPDCEGMLIFRDTMAVELLLAGVPIERVSVLLGHQSVRVTEKHYNPWVRSRQQQLEEDLVKAWARDPFVLEESATRRLREQGDRVN